jgi:hypothetical protein
MSYAAEGQRMAKPQQDGGIAETYPGSEYDADEIEFLMAMELYRRKRPFPTWTEVLKVLKSLGYRKVEPAQSQGDKCPS